MFTLQQLKAAHSKVKTGTDFPKYIQEIKALGLITYQFAITNGQTTYYGSNGHQVQSASIYAGKLISAQPEPTELRKNIAIHQQGQTDFLTFCEQSAQAGVEKWVIDTQKMLCIYYDLAGTEMVAEPIPSTDYQ